MATVEEIKQDIVDYLNETNKYGPYSVEQFGSDFYEWIEALTWPRGKEIELKSGTAKTVQFVDAGEGDYSADTLLVFSVGEQLFRVDGHYESWAGGEWEANAMYEVEPVPVQVIEYKRKAN